MHSDDDSDHIHTTNEPDITTPRAENTTVTRDAVMTDRDDNSTTR
jgi:hypothetical protein